MIYRVLGALAAACLAAPGAASAAQIVAGPGPVTYTNPQIEIAAGESVSFLNFDLSGAPHDVTSTDVGPGAKPLFRSETVGFPMEVPVTGAETLKPGSYDYLCSVHTFMEGSITVGGGAGGADTPPKLALSAVDRRLEKVEEEGVLRVRAKVSEKATVRVVAKLAGEGLKIASERTELKGGRSVVEAKLNGDGKRALAKAKRLDVEIRGRATDVSGNPVAASLALTLR